MALACAPPGSARAEARARLRSAAERAHYGCIESQGYGIEGDRCYTGDPAKEFPCAKMLCVYLCSCDATGCTTPEGGTPDIQLDAALDASGTELTGTLVAPVGGRLNVRMARP